MKKFLSSLEAKGKQLVERIEAWEDTLPTAMKIAFRIIVTILGLATVASAFWLRWEVEPNETFFYRMLLVFPLIALGWSMVGLAAYLAWPEGPKDTRNKKSLRLWIAEMTKRLYQRFMSWLDDTSPEAMRKLENAFGVLVIMLGVSIIALAWIPSPVIGSILGGIVMTVLGACIVVLGGIFILPPSAQPI